MGPVHAPANPSRAWLISAAAGLAGVVLICTVSAGGYVSATRWFDRTLDVRQSVYEWSTAMLDVVIAARTFVASGQVDRFTIYEHAREEERRQAAVVRNLVADNGTQRSNVEAADRDALALTERLRELVSSHGDQALGGLQTRDGTPELDAFRRDLLGIRGEEDRLLAGRRADADLRGWLTLGGTLLLVLTSSAFLLLAWRREQRHRDVLTRAADESRARLEMLSRLAASLADVRTCEEIAGVIVEQGSLAVRADAVTLHLANEDGTALELIGDGGFAPSIVDAVRTVTETSAMARAFAAFKSRTSTWVESASGDAVFGTGGAPMNGRRAAAFWSVPLVAEDRSVGLLSAGFNEPRSFSRDERVFIQTLASQCAQALLRASRLEHQEEGGINGWGRPSGASATR